MTDLPYGVLIAIKTAQLAVAFSIILWGLKLFKIYITLIGFLLGALVVAVLGGILWHTEDAVWIAGLVLAFVGAAVAWPLQKLFVFILAGLMTVALGLALLGAAGLGMNQWPIAALVLFLVGGAVALSLYEYFIIISLSFGAARTVFDVPASPRTLLRGNLTDLRGQVEFYAEHLAVFLLVISVFVLFSLYFQKGIVAKDEDDNSRKEAAATFRRMAVTCCVIGLAAFVLGRAYGTYGEIVLGLDILSWPAVALISSPLLAWATTHAPTLMPRIPAPLARGGAVALFGVTFMPVVGILVSSAITLEATPPILYYYRAFVPPLTSLALIKWSFALLMYPLLMLYGVFSQGEVSSVTQQSPA